MFTFYILNSFQFYIQNFSDGLYLSDVRNGSISRSVIAADKSGRVEFTSTITSDGSHIIKPATSDHVMDVKNQSELIYWPKHGAGNQQFKFILVLPKTYLIQNSGKCVEYSPSSKKYLLKPCTDKDLQKFIISTPEDEEQEKKISENLFYKTNSSSSETGSRVKYRSGSDAYGYSNHKIPVISSDSQHVAHHTKRRECHGNS
jgi:hypothetical protein